MSDEATPNGWHARRFDEMAIIVNDRIDDPSEADVDRYVGLEHLDPDSLTIRRWGSPDDVEATKLRFRAGDIIFGRRRVYQRKLAVADFDGICSAHAMVLRAKPEVALPEFLPFFMQSDLFMTRAKEISVGSLSPTINWKTLAKEEFVLPPLDEQERIAHVLRAAEGASESLLTVRSCSRDLRTSHMDCFFKPRLKDGLTLSTVARVFAGNTPARSHAALWGGDLPWASGKDLKVRNLSHTEDRLTEAGWTLATIAPTGATLIVVRGMILAHTFPVARCEREIAFNQDLRALVAGPDVDPDYLLLWTEWAAPWFLRRAATSSHGTKRIEGDVFESALVPVPARSIQKQFVEEHQNLVRGVQSVAARIAIQQRLRQALFRDLLKAQT